MRAAATATSAGAGSTSSSTTSSSSSSTTPSHCATTRKLNPPLPQDMFQWNFYQSEELRTILGPIPSEFWCLPMVHGSFQQRRFDIFGRQVDLLLLARRSRHYAGTRYLKRGVNVHGKVRR